jgi:hypothetical protein
MSASLPLRAWVMITSIANLKGSLTCLGASASRLLHVRQCSRALANAYRLLAPEYAVVTREE